MADRHNIIFEAARLHFEQGLKQDDVARRLKVSRPTAARYLAMAREMGYVHVRVLDPKGHAYLHDLEIALTERFPALREAILTSSRPESLLPGQVQARRAVADELAERAAGRVDHLLTSRRRNEPPVVAVARGEMIDNVIRHIRPSRPLPELEVLPMLGYLRSREYPYDANRLAQELARIYAGNYEWIPAPGIVTPEEAEVLRHMALVAAPLSKLNDDVNMVLTSISCPYFTAPDGRRVLREQTLLQSGRVNQSEIDDLVRDEGVVGEICGWYYSFDRVVQAPGVEIIGLTPERQRELAADPERAIIAVAGGDPDRFEAILAAIRLGLINVLVTDYLTAHRLLERGREGAES
jgi:DNA-binding transcriptional regulator LsrR (DeoR family)